jgi:shikimate kinase
MSNIILCGFMGCGKTTVGKILSQKLSLPFVDMDEIIEKTTKMTINDIFSNLGEEHFRNLETECAKALNSDDNFIISTGGGAVTRQPTLDALKANGKLFFINVPLKIIFQRLKNDTTRPLFNHNDKDGALQALYEKRLPIYTKAADIVIDADTKLPEEIANMIIEKYQV